MTSPDWRDFDPWLSCDMTPELENMFWGKEFIVSPLVRGQKFNADGNSLAVPKGGSGWNSLILKGWKVATVARVGEVYNIKRILEKRDLASDPGIRGNWTNLAGGPWGDLRHKDSIRFHRTIMAKPEDTKYLNRLQSDRPATYNDIEAQDPVPGSGEYERKLQRLRQLMRLWAGHRFFITTRGKFGLGPAKTERGDHVCILFGCRVPVIFHEWIAVSLKLQPKVDYCTFVGQAHIEDMMNYEGDLEEDVKNKKITVEEFLLH